MYGIQMSRRSEVGARDRNEDVALVGEAPFGWFALVADGAGGHLDGARAAQVVSETAAAFLKAQSGCEPDILAQAIVLADEALRQEIVTIGGGRRMASTLVVLAVDRSGTRASWAHVGDTRLYVLRRGRIAFVTHDDSVVQQMVSAGWIDAKDARNHPAKNQLLAALGSEQPVTPHVEALPWSVADGDAFLLCSDGWWDTMADEQIETSLMNAGTLDRWLEDMASHIQANALRNQDNFTAVGIWIGNPADVTRLVAP